MADNVFINGRAAIHKGSAGKSIAFPDVCLCPPGPPTGPIPTPLVNTAQATDLQGGALTVTIEGNPIAHNESYIAKSTGNEIARSTGGGIITGQVQGRAYFQTYSRNVFIEGKPAVRHLDLVTHNHLSKIPGNTPPTPWMSAMTAPTPVKPGIATKQEREGKAWIEVALLDVQGQPVPFTACEMRTPKGALVTAHASAAGILRIGGLANGSCQATFPAHDTKGTKTKPGDKTGQAPKPCEVSKADKAYQPGRALTLPTGRTHKIELPVQPSFWLQLEVTARDASTMEDEYILASDDGAYQVRRTVARDHLRGATARALEFPGIYAGPSYSLTHQPAGGFAPYVVFNGRPFSALLQSSRRRGFRGNR
jgi:hypothetical protein